LVLTRDELECLKEHSPLPDRLDTHTAPGQIDISDTFVIPSISSFHSHVIGFFIREKNDAIRVFVAR
jgi:hypothetical protein